jgi:hypothetical protein
MIVRALTHRVMLVLGLGVLAGSIGVLLAGAADRAAPQFDTDGALLRPEGYREWMYIGHPGDAQRSEQWQSPVSRVP